LYYSYGRQSQVFPGHAGTDLQTEQDAYCKLNGTNIPLAGDEVLVISSARLRILIVI
jgi:hypothetical protein